MTQQPAQPVDLDAIETRARAATPGPWDRYPQYGAHFYANTTGEHLIGIGHLNFGEGEQADADETFVRHAREDIDALLAEVRRLRAEREGQRAYEQRLREQHDRDVAELNRLRSRVAELERPAIEAKRNEIRDSYAELIATCQETKDYEGAFVVQCRLREREEQWATEDAAAAVPAVPATTKDGAQ